MNQAAFAGALLDPEAPVPEGLVDPEGRSAARRFSVYRNNVASSLTRALEAAFPTVRKLVGDQFFGAMAVVFLRAHPPTSCMLMLYGDAFPEFLEGFPPVRHLGYLPDVARVDQAMRESYHAADAQALDAAAFQRLIGADLAGLRLRLAPSLRLVRSAWPVVSISTAIRVGRHRTSASTTASISACRAGLITSSTSVRRTSRLLLARCAVPRTISAGRSSMRRSLSNWTGCGAGGVCAAAGAAGASDRARANNRRCDMRGSGEGSPEA